ncbi:MAG: hypothetical protein IJB84_07870 [Lachnospiraceae bacterium]|nr:hypothetical protein [Lachnospiraceae bacterium]
MSKFEKRFGKYAIQNLSLMLIMCYVAGYIIQFFNGSFLSYLTLNPYAILHGQVWRLFTWVVVPPDSLGIFTIISLMFYYSIGTTLERTWGTYRYNVYIFSGLLFTVLGGFLWMGLEFWLNSNQIALMGAGNLFAYGGYFFSTYYVNMSIFLAFAATFPNMQVLLMFFIPLRVKWLGILYGVLLGIEFLDCVKSGNLMVGMAIASSLLNFVIFYLNSRKHLRMSPKQMKRHVQFKQEVRKSTPTTRHKCAICGRTEKDDPNLEFRFCSKCHGNYEYCSEHLFTHTHVQ